MSNARNLANLLGTSSTLPASKAPDGTRILIHSYALGVDTANVSFDNTHITNTQNIKGHNIPFIFCLRFPVMFLFLYVHIVSRYYLVQYHED